MLYYSVTLKLFILKIIRYKIRLTIMIAMTTMIKKKKNGYFFN
jgi:hypothetical protein